MYGGIKMNAEQLRKQFDKEVPIYNEHPSTQRLQYIRWLESRLIEADKRISAYQLIDQALAAPVDVCPKCGCSDIVITIYCNKCKEAH